MEKNAEAAYKKEGVRANTYQDYRELLDKEDLDGVIIPSSWTSHAEIAIASNGKRKICGSRSRRASSVQECWDLVRTSERTGKPCMMLEKPLLR